MTSPNGPDHPAGSTGSRPPNLLLLHCHDLGRFLGCYGIPTVQTPAIDALAAGGTRFTRMFCTAPQCSPSRASLFTGTYPQRHGVLGLTHSWFGFDLAANAVHLATRLRAAGFATRLLGAHHESRTLPDPDVAARLGFDQVRTGGPMATVAARAAAALGELAGGDRPFYLQVGCSEPHRAPGPSDPPGVMGFLGDHLAPDTSRGVTVPPYLYDDAGSRAEIGELQGAVRAMDAGVGRVLAALDASGAAGDTVVVFTTDHGLALPAAKCTLYDPGIEVAFVVRAPRRARWTGGAVVDALASNVDVVPTLLDLLGVDASRGQAAGSLPLAGRSLVAAVESGAAGRAEVFAQLTCHDYYDPRRCVRTATHKLLANFSSAPEVMDCSQSWRPRSMPRRVHGSTVAYHPPLELYDLAADPVELTNLADDADPALRADLVGRLVGWMREVDDPLLAGAFTSPLHRTTLARLGVDP